MSRPQGLARHTYKRAKEDVTQDWQSGSCQVLLSANLPAPANLLLLLVSSLDEQDRDLGALSRLQMMFVMSWRYKRARCTRL
jgi:hypothetical protein